MKRAYEFEKQLEMHGNNAEILKKNFRTMEEKISEIKRKKGILSAKQKQAETQEKIYQTITLLMRAI